MGKQRLDKWLFFSRAVKSRTLAQKLVETGAVRVNSERTVRTDHQVGTGDVLTMNVHTRLLVWKILDPGIRRGPSNEAQTLYEDLSPPPLLREAAVLPIAAREPGAGRPTKKERRDTDRLREDEE
ncbi:MAG: RNA-binding S4 domain-containing protein [Devosia sp.]